MQVRFLLWTHRKSSMLSQMVKWPMSHASSWWHKCSTHITSPITLSINKTCERLMQKNDAGWRMADCTSEANSLHKLLNWQAGRRRNMSTQHFLHWSKKWYSLGAKSGMWEDVVTLLIPVYVQSPESDVQCSLRDAFIGDVAIFNVLASS